MENKKSNNTKYKLKEETIKFLRNKYIVEKILGIVIVDYYTIVDKGTTVNVPKSKTDLTNEYLAYYYRLNHCQFKSESEREKVQIALKEVYAYLKEKSKETKSALTNNTPPVPQAIPVKEIVQKPQKINPEAMPKVNSEEIKKNPINKIQQTDEFGVEISRILEEMKKMQQEESQKNEPRKKR